MPPRSETATSSRWRGSWELWAADTRSGASPTRCSAWRTGPGPAARSEGAQRSDPLMVDVSSSICTPGLIGRLKDLFVLFPGQIPVMVRLRTEEGSVVTLRLGKDFCVDGAPALLSELRRLLGD